MMNYHGAGRKKVKSGASDIMITIPTEERLTYAEQSTDPFFQLYLHVMTYAGHKDMDAINKIKSVKDILSLNLTVGSNLGNGWIKQNIKKQGVPVYYVSDDENILNFLKSRRPDITIDVPVSMNLLIEKMGLQSDIVITPARFGPINMHLMISKKSKFLKLLPEINRIFANLIAEDRIDAILRKFKAIL